MTVQKPRTTTVVIKTSLYRINWIKKRYAMPAPRYNKITANNSNDFFERKLDGLYKTKRYRKSQCRAIVEYPQVCTSTCIRQKNNSKFLNSIEENHKSKKLSCKIYQNQNCHEFCFEKVIDFLCVHFTSFITPMWRSRTGLSARHVKPTELILQIGYPSSHLTSWRKSTLKQMPSAQTPNASHLHKQAEKNDLDIKALIYKCSQFLSFFWCFQSICIHSVIIKVFAT